MVKDRSMSIFSSLDTAVSGLNAQSQAFSNLSNNISNSQTVGYKATDTAFEDFVTNSASGNSGTLNDGGGSYSDSVAANTIQRNDVQGTITSSTNALALAISGNGFFNVQEASGSSASSSPTFSGQQYYTRNGDFSRDANGYLVNTSGQYLEGYQVGTNGQMGTTLQPLQIQNVAFTPTESTTMTVSGTIGSSTTSGASTQTTATAYSAQGTPQSVGLNWQQSTTNPLDWTVSNSADPTNSTSVTFNSDGTLASVGSESTSGATGSFSFTGSPQDMTVNLGTIGQSSGIALSTTTTSTASDATMTTDSVTSGTFQGLSMQSDGSVMATFNNGLSQLVGKIPLATFANPNGLAPADGQAYTATEASGGPTENAVNTGAAGSLETGSTESSTTDLTGDLTQLIVAQQAYGANSKVVSTADQLMQTTIAMIQ